MPDYTITVRRQHRRTMMMRAVPGGYEVFIPTWLGKNNATVRAFIQAGIQKLGDQVRPIPAEQTSRDHILNMVHQWAARIGVEAKRVQFREMSRKWGSCSSGQSITLSSRLCWLPPHLAEYVVCHELAHLKVFNHGKEFKALMTQHMPDWREREKELDAIHWG